MKKKINLNNNKSPLNNSISNIDEPRMLNPSVNKKRKLENNEEINEFICKKPKINVNINNKSPKLGLIANTCFDENLIIENYLGPMNVLCKFCKAKHFISEISSRNTFKNCCHNGKVLINENIDYPDDLKNILITKNSNKTSFLNNLRIYNNLLAFASFGAKFDYLKTKGPQVFRICGQVYHNSYSLHRSNDESKKYGQLYIVDNEIVNNIGLLSNEKKNVDNTVLDKLNNILKNINIYSKS